MSPLTRPCPCGTGSSYDACCAPLLADREQAAAPNTVEFVARWEGGQMHEVSRFEQRAGLGVYVDGVVD